MVKFSAPHEIVNKYGNFISKRGNEMNNTFIYMADGKNIYDKSENFLD